MSHKKFRVYVGLGSNLNNPAGQIKTAVNALHHLPETHYVTDSGLFLSKAMQTPDDKSQQPDYYNAVALLETLLKPVIFLKHLQRIEQHQGRIRKEKWGARTLDLDILLYGDLTMRTEMLQIPHPGCCQREFVLYPLQNIDPTLEIPGHGKLQTYIQHCPENGLQYLGNIK